MKINTATQQIKNQKGMVSADFIFSLVLAAGVSAVLFAVTFTLSMVEVAQYISFSSARAMAPADLSVSDQELAAKNKYKELLATPAFKPLLSTGGDTWFILSKDLEVRLGGPTGKTFITEYGAGDSNRLERREIYTGVRFDFKPKLMALRIAIVGTTSLAGDGSEFAAKINTIMLREPSFDECVAQQSERYNQIGRMPASGSGGRYGEYAGRGQGKFLALEDNGC